MHEDQGEIGWARIHQAAKRGGRMIAAGETSGFPLTPEVLQLLITLTHGKLGL